MTDYELAEFTPDQRERVLRSCGPVANLTDTVSATRPLDEQLDELGRAFSIWRACGEDAALARRWVLATRGDPGLVERCIDLELEPEQLGRVTLDALETLDDQELLDLLAAQPEPAWCCCGWPEWEATATGWTCPHCGVTVRRDPRE